jgi:hypothetical protein
MSRRLPRVPGTRADNFRLEVATGGDPAGAFVRAAEASLRLRTKGVWLVDVRHDDGCPAIGAGPMRACTCEIVELRGRRA